MAGIKSVSRENSLDGRWSKHRVNSSDLARKTCNITSRGSRAKRSEHILTFDTLLFYYILLVLLETILRKVGGIGKNKTKTKTRTLQKKIQNHPGLDLSFVQLLGSVVVFFCLDPHSCKMYFYALSITSDTLAVTLHALCYTSNEWKIAWYSGSFPNKKITKNTKGYHKLIVRSYTFPHIVFPMTMHNYVLYY